jgi:hypothetical protein
MCSHGANDRPITERMVAARIDEVLGHRPTCTCGHCEAAAKVRPAHVLMIAAAWQRAITATRVRAAR